MDVDFEEVVVEAIRARYVTFRAESASEIGAASADSGALAVAQEMALLREVSTKIMADVHDDIICFFNVFPLCVCAARMRPCWRFWPLTALRCL